MSTIKEQVVLAIVAAHEVAQVTGGASTATKPTDLTIHRFIQRPITADELPAQVIAVDRNAPERFDIDRNLNRLSFTVETRIELPDDEAPDEAMEDYLIWSHRCLKSDETLGGLAMQITEGETEWGFEVGEKTYASAATSWTVEFVTREIDPRQQ